MDKTRPRVKEPKVYADPAIKEFVRLLRESEMTNKEFFEKSGLTPSPLYGWLTGSSAYVNNLRAALNTLGYDLLVVKKLS